MFDELIKGIEGVIFDLDGTLIDSSMVWDMVDVKFLGERGFEVPPDYVENISPLGPRKAAEYTIKRFSLDEDPNEMIREWYDLAKIEYETTIVCKSGVKDFVHFLKKNGIKMAIATSSDRELFIPTLEREKIIDCFDEIVTVEEVGRGKRFPDIYIEAARRMGIPPRRCIVFEDLPAAIESAKSGGFKTAAVYDRKHEESRDKLIKIADYYIEDFRKIP